MDEIADVRKASLIEYKVAKRFLAAFYVRVWLYSETRMLIVAKVSSKAKQVVSMCVCVCVHAMPR